VDSDFGKSHFPTPYIDASATFGLTFYLKGTPWLIFSRCERVDALGDDGEFIRHRQSCG
jgi:hypothetical protein